VTSFIPFADTMGIDSQHVPADPKFFRLVALYATGTNGIEATAAEIARFTNAGVGVVLIDQSPSLSVFAAGIAHVAIADVEPGAGTPTTVAEGVLAREKKGLESTIYVSEANLQAAKDALHTSGADSNLVSFGLANWNLSQAEAETQISSDQSLAYVQWASPSSNPLTVLPGAGMDLAVANVDLNIADLTWAARFLPQPTFAGPYWHSLGSETIAQYARSRGHTSPVKMLSRSYEGWSAAQRREIIDKATEMIVSTVYP